MRMLAYWKTVLRSVLAGTFSHVRNKLLLGLVLSMIALGLQYLLRVRSWSDSEKIAISLVGSAVIVMIGSFIKHLVTVPASIHQKQEQEIEKRDVLIHDLTSQLATPAVPQQDLERRQRVRTLIAGATAEEIKFLKFINDREEIPYEHGYHDRSREAVDSSIAKWRNKLIQVRVERDSNATYWSIAPGLKDALVYVLYEQPPKP
jgi:hypothetical protein